MLEAMQFKQQFIPNLDKLLKNKMQCDDQECGWIIRLPQSLPTSSIVEKKENFEQQIVSLYNKYISDDADLCINISYEARQEFMIEMDNVITASKEKESDLNSNGNIEATPKVQIVKIFDGALKDINTNLSCSFVRFQLYGNIDATQQDIIDVMMEQTK